MLLRLTTRRVVLTRKMLPCTRKVGTNLLHFLGSMLADVFMNLFTDDTKLKHDIFC